MRARLLIDNWTLQHVARLLEDGFDGETVDDMEVSKSGRSFKYAETPEDLIKIECLVQVLSSIVFADELFVDDKFVSAWEGSQELSVLRRERIVIGKPFYDLAEKWVPARETIARELCFCPKVRRLHDENVKNYRKNKTVADPLLSQLLWGGAGYLARANFFGMPYLPYPLRERLFVRASMLLGPAPAYQQLQEFVTGERIRIFKRMDATGYYARLNLAPVAVRVVQESTSPRDMLKVAVQFRDEFRGLRGWLSEFQQALNTEDVKEIAARRKVFESVAKHVDGVTKLSPEGETSLQFGLNWLKVVTKSGSPANSVRNLFGVRAAMNRLVLAPPGGKAFRKLLGLFGESNSTRGRQLARLFLERSAG